MVGVLIQYTLQQIQGVLSFTSIRGDQRQESQAVHLLRMASQLAPGHLCSVITITIQI